MAASRGGQKKSQRRVLLLGGGEASRKDLRNNTVVKGPRASGSKVKNERNGS